jgi:cell division protease FtsH
VNSATKSLVFWMALMLVGVLVWNFSTSFQTASQVENFSVFMSQVDAGQVTKVTLTGNEITYTTQGDETLQTYAPPNTRASPTS